MGALILQGALGKKPPDALAIEEPAPADSSLASEADGSDFSLARQQIGVAATEAKERPELFAIAKFRDDEFRLTADTELEACREIHAGLL